MTEVKPIHPEIIYAERCSLTDEDKNIIYFTINAPDIKGEPKLDIKPTGITFEADAGDSSRGVPEKKFAFDLELYDEIIPEATKKMVTTRAIVLVLRKKTPKAEYWPRLTKEKPNKNWIKTDFSKWVDEDEQDAAPEDLGGMDDMMGGMGGMPGMGGMGGMPGMGGMGGMGGMPGMGGLGGMGGPGGMDFAKMMESMGGAGALGGDGPNFDSDDDEVPEDDEEGETIEEISTDDKGKGKGKAVDTLESVE
ncbi:hypothetical protein M231_05978 [Tremella mesenterica]|uniref:CS domain-containing protein n=1 Tax=Tremella mesenterica TaxID=5217 RepID=A0A4Q1BGN8_TREME|nr:hypothetical protein M231_05978 [Tremella mesenterica]